MTIDVLIAYADIAYENKQFIDEIDIEVVCEELDKRVFDGQ